MALPTGPEDEKARSTSEVTVAEGPTHARPYGGFDEKEDWEEVPVEAEPCPHRVRGQEEDLAAWRLEVHGSWLVEDQRKWLDDGPRREQPLVPQGYTTALRQHPDSARPELTVQWADLPRMAHDEPSQEAELALELGEEGKLLNKNK